MTQHAPSLNGCWNRPELGQQRHAQDGWHNSWARRIVAVPFLNTTECQYTHSDAGRTDAGCVGCRHRAP